jgi:ankyrin repeat protein
MVFPQQMSKRGQQEEEQGMPDTRTEAGREYMRKIENQMLLQSTVSQQHQRGDQSEANKKFSLAEERVHKNFNESFENILMEIKNPSRNKKNNNVVNTYLNAQKINSMLLEIKSGFDSGFISPLDSGKRSDTLLAQIMTVHSNKDTASASISDNLRWKTTQTLLEYGARPDAVGQSGRSALHEFASRPDIDVKYLHAMLLKRPNVNVKDAQGKSPMDLAIESGNEKAIGFLRAAGAKDNNVIHTFAHVAANQLLVEKDEPYAIQKFENTIRALQANGYNLNAQDANGLRMEDILRKNADEQFVNQILALKTKIVDETKINPRLKMYLVAVNPSVSIGSFDIEQETKNAAVGLTQIPVVGNLFKYYFERGINKINRRGKDDMSTAINGQFFDNKGKIRSSENNNDTQSPANFFNRLATDPKLKQTWHLIDINQSLLGSPHGDTALMHAVRTGDQDTIRAILSLPPELQPDLNKMNDKGETAALLAAQRGDVGTLRLLMGTVVTGPNGEPRLQHVPEAPENMKKSRNLADRNMVFQNGEDLLMQAQRWASLNSGEVTEEAMRNVDGTSVKKIEGITPNTAIVEQMIAEMGFERPDWKPEKTMKVAINTEIKPDAALLNPRMSDASLREPVDKEDMRKLAKHFVEHQQQLVVNIDKIKREVAKMEPGHDQDMAYKAADDLQKALYDNIARANVDVVIAAFQIAVHNENYKTANLLLETIKNEIEMRPSTMNPWAKAVLPVDWIDPDFYKKNLKDPVKHMSPIETSIMDLTTIKTNSASSEREEEIETLAKNMEFLMHTTMGPNGSVLRDVHARTHDPKVAAQIEEQLRAWESEAAPNPK